ncbi:MAG: TadE/TadG family type IV pilus assembly protein [Terriglobales bacterium]
MAELAMVLPLLLFLGLAVTEGGGFVRAHQMLNNAAREGAKFSTLQTNQGDIPAIRDVVDTYLKNASSTRLCVSATGCAVSSPLAVVTVDQCVTIAMPSGPGKYASQVDVSYAYQLQYLPRLPWFNFPATVTLRGRATFVNFYGC